MHHAWSKPAHWLRFLGAPLALGLALVFLPSAASAASGRTWHVGVGTDTPDKAIQGNVFLSQQITVDVGDTVDWSVDSAEPHTVSFLFGATAPSAQAPGNVSGSATISSPADGSPIVNTGLLDKGSRFKATFTAPGTYLYRCLLHPGMSGSVVVNPDKTPYPHPQGFYNQQSNQESRTVLDQGKNLFQTGLNAAQQGGADSVTAGEGASLAPTFLGNVFVARFQPAQRTVHKGDTVTWTNFDPTTPHTVTIGPTPANPRAAAGGNTVTTAPDATTLNSGFLGPATPAGPATFAVTFDQAGTYSYYCALHSSLGMKGTLVVLP